MPFPRPVIFEACAFLGVTIQYHGDLEDMLLRWELDELEARPAGGIQQRCREVFRFLRDNPEVRHDGRLISDLLVEEVTRRVVRRHGAHGDAIVHELARAGYLLNEDGTLRRTLPEALFELSQGTNGTWTEKVLHSFNNSDGSGPEYSMIFDTAGNLYGTTFFGRSAGGGVVFRLKPVANGWKEEVLHSFGNGSEGFYPVGSLSLDAAGNLYGTTNASSGTGNYGAVYQLSSSGNGSWSVTVLHSFTGGEDGANPSAGVILDAAGNLYGTTYQGGNSGCGGKGCGTVFELSPSGNGKWNEKALHRFNGANGANPESGLISDGARNLYGTTRNGGRGGCNPPTGCGTVFEISPGTGGRWTEKVLRSFRTNPKDPTATLVFDSSGNLYGTTSTGGTGCSGYGCGKVFKLTPSGNGKWTYSVLRRFRQNGKDGNTPYAGVVLDSAGNLYGTTYQGGSGIWNIGCGTVFEITP